jgi:hypothetical protein
MLPAVPAGNEIVTDDSGARTIRTPSATSRRRRVVALAAGGALAGALLLLLLALRWEVALAGQVRTAARRRRRLRALESRDAVMPRLSSP